MILLSLTIILVSLIFRKYIFKGVSLTNINLGTYKEVYVEPYIKRTEEDYDNEEVYINKEKLEEVTQSQDIKLEDIIRM